MAVGFCSPFCAVFVCVLLVTQYLPRVAAHGSMLDPAQRSAMWMYGFKTPTNYDYNGLNCGGFLHQWSENGGKCGLCGDSYSGERMNEDGGRYATGTIAKSYLEDSSIEVRVELSANHGGWFEFRLCARNSQHEPLTQECLDRHLLASPEGKTRYYPGFSQSSHVVSLKLPVGVSCSHCVLQWKYNGGNSWGCGQSYRCCMGCGEQEQFYNCADVDISQTSGMVTKGYHGDDSWNIYSDKTTKPNVNYMATISPVVYSYDTISPVVYSYDTNRPVSSVLTTKPATAWSGGNILRKKPRNDKNKDLLAKMGIMEITDMVNNVIQVEPLSESGEHVLYKKTKKTNKPSYRPRGTRCKGKGVWQFVSGMGTWCEQNCTRQARYPPSGCPTHCKCKY